jgi:transcriptional regulator with XRE-family HTH domain
MTTTKYAENVVRPTICIRVGHKIRELRDSKGWSQRMLADHAGIENAHLARLELGQREAGLLILQKIADALEVPVWELLK